MAFVATFNPMCFFLQFYFWRLKQEELQFVTSLGNVV